jgi:hypothetical protein
MHDTADIPQFTERERENRIANTQDQADEEPALEILFSVNPPAECGLNKLTSPCQYRTLLTNVYIVTGRVLHAKR